MPTENNLFSPKASAAENKKSIFVFDFDLTLTLQHTYQHFNVTRRDMTQKEIETNVKEDVGNALHAIMKAGDEIYILTRNQYPQLLREHLVVAGLTKQEAESIPILCPPLHGTMDDEAFKLTKDAKFVNIVKNRKDVSNVYYFDDEEPYLKAAEAAVKKEGDKLSNIKFEYIHAENNSNHLKRVIEIENGKFGQVCEKLNM